MNDTGMLCMISGVGKAFASAIVEERSVARFIDAEDALRRLRKRKGLKNVEECVKRFRYN